MSDEIRAKFGYTINMGNSEWCRIDLDINIDKCTSEREENKMIDRGFNLLGKLEKKIMTKVQEIEEEEKE